MVVYRALGSTESTLRVLSILVKLYDHLSLGAPSSNSSSNDDATLREATIAELTALSTHVQESKSPITNGATLANAWSEIREVESIIVGVERAVLASLRRRMESN